MKTCEMRSSVRKYVGNTYQQRHLRVSSFTPLRPQVSYNAHILHKHERNVVLVQANLFARVSRIIMSFFNGVVSQAEDPEKLLDQVVLEMQSDVIKMRQAAAQVMATQKQMEAKYKQAQATADDWLRRAELAVQKGEDELARQALTRRKTYQTEADTMKAQIEQQQKAVDQILANTRALENKLMEAKSKKETLKARAASAKTSKQIQEMLSGLNTGSNAVAAFEQMETKVVAMEAEAETTGLLVAGDGLENKFLALEGGSVEDELAALKKGMLSAPRSMAPVAMPAGRPMRDYLDLELEELKRKAQE